MKILNRSDISFFEAVSIITGHGLGAGVLSVPYLASRSSFSATIIIIGICALFNILLHLLISELSLNNNGAQFVTCFKSELFTGSRGKALTWIAFVLIGISVVVSVSAYLTGAAAVFNSWFGLHNDLGILLFYFLCSFVVLAGAKLVGMCEKYAVWAMTIIVFLLFFTVLSEPTPPVIVKGTGWRNALALFSIVSFSLSAVMSTPIVVKGLGCSPKRIRRAIITGILVNTCIILLITFTTLIGTGGMVTENGALVDLAEHFGGKVRIAGYIFSLLALATSFWANSLNLRNIVSEQLKINRMLCWLIATALPLAYALLTVSSFVSLSRFSGVVLVITCLAIILSYNKSRKRTGNAPVVGSFGRFPFQAAVIALALLASLGAVLKVR